MSKFESKLSEMRKSDDVKEDDIKELARLVAESRLEEFFTAPPFVPRWYEKSIFERAFQEPMHRNISEWETFHNAYRDVMESKLTGHEPKEIISSFLECEPDDLTFDSSLDFGANESLTYRTESGKRATVDTAFGEHWEYKLLRIDDAG